MKLHTLNRIHFLGIGGSGVSGVACMAKAKGYDVSGCDSSESTAYSKELTNFNIPIAIGHNVEHLEGKDALIVSPAVMFKDPLEKEVEIAQKQGNLLTWQKFLGDHLHAGKKVICISGTHGKSTTTAMASAVFEKANLDPSAMVGAVVKKWETNFRVGEGEVFLTESDEFYDNFLNYSPDVIVLNNIEFDHPDYYSSLDQLYESFKKHVLSLKGMKLLIINQDSVGNCKLFKDLDKEILRDIKVIGYTLGRPLFHVENSVCAKAISLSEFETNFSVQSAEQDLNDQFSLKVQGLYNIENSLGVIILAKIFGIKTEHIKVALAEFDGIGRRMELLGEKNGIKVFDDYAHHPTAVRKTLSALRERNRDSRIIVVIEPHSFSRTKALLDEYSGTFESADSVIIGPIYKARDTQTFNITGNSIVEVSGHQKICYIENVEEIIKTIKKEVQPDTLVVVMGAGNSYKWAREILKHL